MGKKRRRTAKRASEKGEEGRAEAHAERLAAIAERRRKVRMTWGFVAAALALLFILAIALRDGPSPYVGFAECLGEAGATMYGTDWCSHCQEQKRMFGTAFKQVPYVNCDYSAACEEAGILGFPTWTFADGTRLPGAQSFQVLAAQTGCALPEDA